MFRLRSERLFCSFRDRSLNLIAALLLILALPQSASAQPAPASTTQSTNPTQAGATAAAQSTEKNEPQIPDFYLASVEIDAAVNGDRVNMDATVEVVINRDNGWQRVPLRFDQAHIWSREYSGPGEEAPDFSAESGADGIYWMLRGKGKHQLKFRMWTPVRRSVIGSRLQFSLPPLSAQFDTRLRLKIPEPNAILRASPNLTIQEIKRDAQSTTFETSVSKNRLDAIWTVSQGSAELASKVTTRFHLKPSIDSLLLVADQSIEMQQQDARELIVRLPTEFEPLTTEVSQRPFQPIPDRPGWVKINLMEPTTGKIDLHWEFRKPMNKAGERVMIDGLEIEGAAQEGGTIRIDDLSGYRIIPQMSDSRLVYRVNFNEMRMNESENSNSVYEFLQQPFRIVQELRPIEPLHSVTLIHQMRVTPEKMILDVHQLIDIERGSVSVLPLQWPNFSTSDWKFLRTTTASLVSGEVISSINDETGMISFKLPAPAASGEHLHLVSRFEKSISLDESSEIRWTLPHTLRENSRGELLIMDNDDQLEIQFEEPSSSRLSPVPSQEHTRQLSEIWKLPKGLQSLLGSSKTSLVDTSSNDPFQAIVTQHERNITVQGTVEIREATSQDLLVHQQFDLNIEYGRLQSLELYIPPELQKLMEPAGVATGLVVEFEGEPQPLSTIGGVPRIIFPRPLIGRTSFQVQYRFPIDVTGERQKVMLPVVSLEQFLLDQVSCLVTPVENVQLVQDDSGWVAAQTYPRGPMWIKGLLNERFTSIPLTIGGSLSDSSQQFLVEHAYLWTRFEEDGRAKTLARYEVISPPERLLITFPPNTEFLTFVDGQPLPESSILRKKDRDGQVVLNLPDGIRERRTLEFRYITEEQSKFSFAEQQTFQFPQFTKSVWVNETVWEFELPFGFHLFEYPDLKPLFNWERKGIIWERKPSKRYSEERYEMLSQLPETFQFRENFYAFQGYTPVEEVRFRSMNRSLILLIGAGFALLLGFVFYRFPVTRNVFSLVVLAFVFAVASVWYLDPMLLLLQPAVIGVLLALMATIIDVRSNRATSDHSTIQRRRTLVTDSQMELLEEQTDGTTRIYTPTASSGSDLSHE